MPDERPPKLKSDLTKAEEEVVLAAVIMNADRMGCRLADFREDYSERVVKPICCLDEDPEPNTVEDRALTHLWAIEDEISHAERHMERIVERIKVYKEYLDTRSY